MILKSVGRRHLRSYRFVSRAICALGLGMWPYEAKECWILIGISVLVISGIRGVELASFFLARSPEAPRMTRMVFSRISRGADMLSRLWLVDTQTFFTLIGFL